MVFTISTMGISYGWSLKIILYHMSCGSWIEYIRKFEILLSTEEYMPCDILCISKST